MKHIFFLKKTHINSLISVYITLLYILIIVLIVAIALRYNEVSLGLVVVFISSTIAAFIAIKYFNSIGLYINDTNIRYKGILVRNISVDDIAGIKILPAYSAGKYRGFYPLKDDKGNLLYAAIVLKTIDASMYNYQEGDLWFNSTYKKNIICSVTYDKDAVDYLKQINSKIEII